MKRASEKGLLTIAVATPPAEAIQDVKEAKSFRTGNVKPDAAPVQFPWPVVRRLPPGTKWCRRYRVSLLVVDASAIIAAIGTTYSVVTVSGEEVLRGFNGFTYGLLAMILLGGWLLSLNAVNSRDIAVLGAGLEEYRRVLKATLYFFGGLAIGSYIFRAEVSRGLFVVSLPLGMFSLLVGRWLARSFLNRFRGNGRALTSTLVVGAPSAAFDVIEDLRKRPTAGYRADAVCLIGDVAEADQRFRGICVHQERDLFELAQGAQYGALIVTEGLGRKQLKALAWQLENQRTDLLLVPRITDVAGPRLAMRDVEGLSLMHVDLPRFDGAKAVVKRLFDVVVSVAALVALSPLLAVVALSIKLDDGGPILFRQQRIGRHGKPFTIHKFRTMCVDAEAKLDALIAANGGNALLFKLPDDARITRVGKVLRKYSLDELPQFWTALWGKMSVVGPRPQVVREVAEYTDIHHRSLLIKPGITGLWQVSGRSDLSVEESIRLDLRYVENWSLVGDATIILKTVGVVVRPRGAF